MEYIEPQRQGDTEEHRGVFNTNTENRENRKRLNTVNRKELKIYQRKEIKEYKYDR